MVQTGKTNTPTWEALVMPLHSGYDITQNGMFCNETQAVMKKYQAQTSYTADGLIGVYAW